MKNETLINWMLFFIGTIAIIYSTYQTSRGYEEAAGSYILSIGFSVIISSSLILLLFSLRNKIKKSDDSVIGVFIMYTLFALFSVVANFNTFFSGFVKKKLVSEQIDNLNSKFSELETQGIIAIGLADDTDDFEAKIITQKNNLRSQILDRVNPGLGLRAKEQLQSLEQLLDVEFTTPYGSPNDIYSSLSDQIDFALINYTKSSKSSTDSIKSKINTLISGSKKQIASVTSTPGIDDDFNILQTLIKNYNDASGIVNGYVKNDNVFQKEVFSTEVTEVGKIPFAIKNGLDSRYKSYALIALFICFALDFFVPALVYFVTPQKKRKKNNSGASWPERKVPSLGNKEETKLTLRDIIKSRNNDK